MKFHPTVCYDGGMGFKSINDALGHDWDIATFRKDLEATGYSVVVEFDPRTEAARRLFIITAEQDRDFDWVAYNDMSSVPGNREQVLVIRFRTEEDALWAKMMIE